MSSKGYTQDFSYHIREGWPTFLAEYKDQPGVRYLEIGCFEGMTTAWMFENILTHPQSCAVVIDTFRGSPEIGENHHERNPTMLERFKANTEAHADRLTIYQSDTEQILTRLRDESAFDIIYVDASHKQKDVLRDAMNAWLLLVRGGILIFDDYLWYPPDHSEELPVKKAVDAFMYGFKDYIQPIHIGSQVVLRKQRKGKHVSTG